ncbi:DMT family transporter [Azohydromonas caseinilytica]|uniref:DMT family transporter n=1 Tax=Azohydromonas caseinilytica TaxID=2728836 RepID=A0A848FB89_9BURK|nr:DMT family transporter [Azohydromonas caseinilytica]NML15709.1 DMT family transporter [Azohydromonas caseinilytica]
MKGERLGIALLVLATASFAALDSTAKAVGAAVPVLVAMWFRYLLQAAATGALVVARKGRGAFATRRPLLHALRGLLFSGSGVLAFLSLRHLPIGEFTALMMLTPLLITLLAATRLGERVTLPQWALVAGSFGGALLVIQPDARDFKWAMLLPLALVVVNAVYQLLTSRLMRENDAATLQLWTGSVAVGVTTLALPWAGPWPVQPQLWALLALMAVFSTAGHTMLTMAYGHARAPTLTPFLYAQVGFATLAGWLVFGHAPDAWTLLGIAVIAACGVGGTWLAGHRAGR